MMKKKLNNAINMLTPSGSRYLDLAFNKNNGGSLVISKNGKNKKVIILLTDAQLTDIHSQPIINEAKTQNCLIYCITVGVPATKQLIEITQQSGGQIFENVSTINAVDVICNKILQLAYGNEPCEIEWESSVSCKNESTKLRLGTKNNLFEESTTFNKPKSSIAKLDFSTSTINFNKPDIGKLFRKI